MHVTVDVIQREKVNNLQDLQNPNLLQKKWCRTIRSVCTAALRVVVNANGSL